MATAVSVIVPVHNEENMLKRTLTSILMLNANEWLFILDRCEDRSPSRGLGDVYKRQDSWFCVPSFFVGENPFNFFCNSFFEWCMWLPP